MAGISRPVLEKINSFRLEFKQGSSDKFYAGLRLGGDEWQITYGRNGSSGQTITYSENEAQNKVDEKLAKGYRVVKDTMGSADAPKKDPRKAVAEDAGSKKFMSELEKL